MKLVRLFCCLLSMSVRRQLAFRADFFFELMLTVVGLASSLTALAMVFTRTDSLGGWSATEAVVLVGTFQIVTGARMAFVEPNLTWFGNQVKDGRFDALVIQPAPPIFLASLGTSAPLALVDVLLGVGVVIVGVGHFPGIIAILGWLVLVGAAIAMMWATRVMLAGIIFWALDLSLDVVYDACWQFARYPVDIYRRPLRLVLTYALPIAVVATTPADVLLGGGVAIVVPSVALGAFVACWLAVLMWRAGLRRYTSATS